MSCSMYGHEGQTISHFKIPSYIVLAHQVIFIETWFIVEIMILTSAITGFFASLNASVAEGIQVSVML